MTANLDSESPLAGRIAGRRVVLTVYLGVVAVAGVMGALLGYVNPEGLDPKFLFVVDLPPTIIGMVVFGTTTVGIGLGVLLLLVGYVSRYDDRKIE